MRLSEPLNLGVYGCTLEQWKIVRGDPSIRIAKSPIQKWKMQKHNAALRGIEWDLSLWQWWCVWQESGRWSERGDLSHQYCMCRNGDVGPYSTANVYIATAKKNHEDAWKSGKQRAPAKAGYGRGYSIRKDCKNKPYCAEAFGKKLGYFATADEARAAYLKAFELSKASESPAIKSS